MTGSKRRAGAKHHPAERRLQPRPGREAPLLPLWPPAPTAPAAAAPPLQTGQRPAAAPATGSRACGGPAGAGGTGHRDHPRPPHSSAPGPSALRAAVRAESGGPSSHPTFARGGRIAPSSPHCTGRTLLHCAALRCIAPRRVLRPRHALHRAAFALHLHCICMAARCLAPLPCRAVPCGARCPRGLWGGGGAAPAGRRRTFQTPHAAAGAAGRDWAGVRLGGAPRRRWTPRRLLGNVVPERGAVGLPAQRRGLHFPWGARKERPPQPPRRRSGDAGTAIRDVVWLCGR